MQQAGSSTKAIRGRTKAASSRGGIQKRKTALGRTDRDGDMVMNPGAGMAAAPKSGRGQIGAAAKPGRGQGSRHGTPTGSTRAANLASQRQQQAILRGMSTKSVNIVENKAGALAALCIKGLSSSKAATNADGGLESLLGFLERKASGFDTRSYNPVRIRKSRLEDGKVYISGSAEDIARIKRLDGWTFASAPLRMEDCNLSDLGGKGRGREKAGLSAEAQQVQDDIRSFLSTRYDAELKLLSLSSLGQDANLQKIGVFDDARSAAKVFPALMATCDKLFETRQAKKESIVSVTLANNDLSDLSHVDSLASTFPDLLNLDLSGNKIPDLKTLEPWRGILRNLENIVVAGNPLEASTPDFAVELMKWYPKLQTLNGITVRTPEDIAVAALHSTPLPINPPDFRDVSQVGENFVRYFFAQYDANRAGVLTEYYDDNTTFSLSINTSPKSNNDSTVRIAPWSAYIKHSRNMTRITHIDSLMRRSHRGSENIQKLWAELPLTKHPDIVTENQKYVVECHPLPGLSDPSGQSPRGVDGLLINVHGEFQEAPSADTKIDRVMRSFSRTFVLGPGRPGGPTIRVVNDMLVLRAWAALKTPWLDLATLGATSTIAPVQQGLVGASGAPGPEQALVIQLCERTGMIPQYAEMCLQESGPDLDKAMVVFGNNKAKLPAEAFINGVIPP